MLSTVVIAFAVAGPGRRLAGYRAAVDTGPATAFVNPAPSDSVPLLKQEADRDIRDHDLMRALLAYSRVVYSAPHDLGAAITLADIYAWTGDYDHAVALYKDVIAQDTVNLAALKGLARVKRWVARYTDAEIFYNKVLSVEPADLDALTGLALTYAQQRNFEVALSCIQKANSLSPNNSNILRTRGDILAWGNHFTAAKDDYLAALRITPASVDILKSLGDLYKWAGKYTDAVDVYGRAHRLEPRNVEVLVGLAETSIDAGLIHQGEESVRELFAIDPGNSQAFEFLRRLEARNSPDYAGLIDGYAKPCVLLLSNLAIAAYFYRRKDRLKNLVRPSVRLAFQLWPAVSVFWAVLFLLLKYLGGLNTYAMTEVAEFGTLAVWMVAFVTLVWATRVQSRTAVKTILAIGAHPDDIELGCGGTLSKYKEMGCRVYGLVVTSGEAGKPQGTGRGDRAREAREGAHILGLDDLWVFEFKDTRLSGRAHAIRKLIEDKIRETNADVIMTQSPHDVHQDHRAVFEATRIAARGNRTLLCYEDVSTESEFTANYYIDISDYLDDKIRAVQAHRTQRHKAYMDTKCIAGRAAHRGLQTGVKYAEAFLLYRGVDLWRS